MKSIQFTTILKGIFFSFILFALALGCSKEDDEPVTPPTAAFTFSPISPKTNEVVTFTNTSANATSYKWSAEGTTFSSTAQNPTYTFTTAGEFNVKLVATGAGGTTELIKKVTVTAPLPAPVAGFTFSPASPKAGEDVVFTNTSTNATSYQWSVEGTTLSSTTQNPTFKFTSAGDFNVKLIATGAGGTNELIKKVTVAAAPVAPVANFTFLPASPKAGEDVVFTNTSTNATSYQWSVEGTSLTSTTQNPTFKFSAAGDFNVKLIATGPGGTNEIIKKVTVAAVSAAPVAGFTFLPASPKAGEDVLFTNTSTNATTYQWSVEGTSLTSTTQNPTFKFNTAGDFNVKLIATGAGGTNEIIKKVTVAAAPVAPVAGFTFLPASPKTGEDVVFTNTSTNATSYQWSVAGTSLTSTTQNPTFKFTTAGDFNVKLIATGPGGTNEITKKVTVLAAPVAGFTFSPTSPKTGEEVTFTNTSTNATSYQWSAVGTSFTSTAQNPKFTFTTAGDFDVKLIATGPGGTNEIIKKVTVTAASGGGGNSNPCNLPECYVQKTTTTTSGISTTINYSYSIINGIKKISQISTSIGFGGSTVTTIQYDAQGRRIKDETKTSNVLSASTEYTYSNGDKTVRANMYDAAGTFLSYSISTYDTNMRLTRTDNYSAAGVTTGYTVYSNFLNIEGSFPQLVQTYNASNAITQTDTHTYQDCQLKSTVSKDGSGTTIGTVNNTIDSNKLLRTSAATIYLPGFTITSNTQFVYDCD